MWFWKKQSWLERERLHLNSVVLKLEVSPMQCCQDMFGIRKSLYDRDLHLDELHAASSFEAVSRFNGIARYSNLRRDVIPWAIKNTLAFHSNFRLGAGHHRLRLILAGGCDLVSPLVRSDP
jgi:hypothetical protein